MLVIIFKPLQDEVQVCVSCISLLSKCYCVKTETESRAQDELNHQQSQGPVLPQPLLSRTIKGSQHRRSSVAPNLAVVTEEEPAFNKSVLKN